MSWKLTDALGRQKQITANNANQSGLLSAKPSPSVLPGGFYYATDQVVLYYSDGSQWYRQSDPAGVTKLWFSNVAPAGHILYDGSTLGSTTGIYADLFAHLGTSTLPDTRGRMPVGLGTHADVSTIGNNEGVATAANRRPKHRTSLTDTGHTHSGATFTAYGVASSGGGTGSVADNASSASFPTGIGVSIPNATTGITVGTGNANDPLDTSPYITFCFIAKL